MHGVQRPLSPHLQIYRWQITMWLSSMHRITGLLLSTGAVVLAVWLLAAAGGQERYDAVVAVLGAAWFKVLYVVWAFCFFLHLGNGVRHLVWDAGSGFERSTIRSSGLTVLAFTVVATAVFSLVVIF